MVAITALPILFGAIVWPFQAATKRHDEELKYVGYGLCHYCYDMAFIIIDIGQFTFTTRGRCWNSDIRHYNVGRAIMATLRYHWRPDWSVTRRRAVVIVGVTVIADTLHMLATHCYATTYAISYVGDSRRGAGRRHASTISSPHVSLFWTTNIKNGRHAAAGYEWLSSCHTVTLASRF